MPLGIIEPKTIQSTLDVPGTEFLEEQGEIVHDAFSKHAPGRPDLILVPSPSDDPADPLNWGRARKEAAFAVLLMGTILAGTCGPLPAPALTFLVGELKISIFQATQLLGSLVLTIGIGSIWFAPLQTKYGTRPTFLLALFVQMFSMLWAGGSKNSYPSLLAARVVQGLSMGCFFNNVPAAINAIYFVHQRGFRMALWNLALIGGINLGPVISAQIISIEGWTFVFWWQGLVAGVTLVAAVFFLPELFYDRSYYDKEIEARRAALSQSTKASGSFTTDEKEHESSNISVPVPVDSKVSSTYALFTGSKSPDSFWKIFFRPFLHVFNPVVIWGALTFSVVFNLLPMISSIYSTIFSAAPYHFTTSQIGLVSGIPPLIGTLIGTVSVGPLTDWSVKALAKRNNGIFEPEFRLIPMAAFCFFGGMGLYGWGMQSSQSWVIPAVFIAILHVGVSAGTVSCIAYVSACAGENAADAVGLVVFVKSVIGFGILFILSGWLSSVGVVKFMVALGSLTVAISGLAIPAWVFGKQARSWYSKTAFAKWGQTGRY
ncbi:MFS general substrate transporter [Meredithblackwellia eburnea MCA 4105]